MIIYKDIFTDDGLFSDSHPFTLVDDLYYEVYGKYKTQSIDVEESSIGGNLSAEESAEQPEIKKTEVINFVAACRLQNCPHVSQEKYLREHFMPYAKKLVDFYLDQGGENAGTVKDKLQQFGAILQEKFKSDNFQFFQGESFSDEGMIALVGHKEKDGQEVPYMILFKDGLKTEEL